MTAPASNIVSSERFLPNDVVTEDSAALRFVELHGDRLRYCHSSGTWYRWNDLYWQPDRTSIAFHWARELVRQLAEDLDERRRYVTSKVAFAAGVERFAKSDPAITTTADCWDTDPFLLGTPGGTLDLRSGKLRVPSQHDGITKVTSVAPLNEPCPRWHSFLRQAMNGDEETIEFLQRWLGYCLTGDTREHALIFCHGGGGNGKGVFLNTVTRILGDYATTAAMDTFTAAKGDRHSTELAMLRGARLVTASETEEGRAWAEARIKQLTGGDPITARFMRQDNFTFQPNFKLTIIGNHKPVLKNVDDAARRRFNIVPFLFKPEKPDRELEQKLMREAGGILQWMVDGCLAWQKDGLKRSSTVLKATQGYFDDQDLFGQWLDECCTVKIGNSEHWDKSTSLFDSWTDFAHKAGEHPGSIKSFKQNMTLRNFEYFRDKERRGYRFVRVQSATP
ncbi:putative DNA primase/helicase [Bradyrhizobium elkanii]|uniref:phage/plasmid primase, P4 family n=1 Tax=Bradyrhizobium elkanii TaxID=29448 RepID=UPI002225E518|nr:phage/plasmid primase, P4 family [Bradyrhizobium elkanii]MCW2110267.1 putative DNA primase/helicase [Bradyrhizobium elkanii]MCW2201359.1 putative DNA primase/helicase [Bradyrhizobium elkanii]MCW2226990.1 putative DNA primase/helicase [Bradyrhizobium elkanii]WLB76436.1 phage/plasmid primase, P4 family [Bradyrhizobium elkanii]